MIEPNNFKKSFVEVANTYKIFVSHIYDHVLTTEEKLTDISQKIHNKGLFIKIF